MNIKLAMAIVKTVKGIGIGAAIIGWSFFMLFQPWPAIIIMAILLLIGIIFSAFDTVQLAKEQEESEEDLEEDLDEEEFLNDEMNEDPDNLEGLGELKDPDPIDNSYRDHYIINIKPKEAQFKDVNKWYAPYQPNTLYTMEDVDKYINKHKEEFPGYYRYSLLEVRHHWVWINKE